jgi:hypothetical protein
MTPNPIEEFMRDIQNRQRHETEIRSKYAKEGYWLKIFIEADTAEEALQRLRSEPAGLTAEHRVFITEIDSGGLDRETWKQREQQEAAASVCNSSGVIPPM